MIKIFKEGHTQRKTHGSKIVTVEAEGIIMPTPLLKNLFKRAIIALEALALKVT